MAWLVEAARPRTLPAAVAPVLVGTAAADRAIADLLAGRFLLALLVALALQVAVNYANDLFDGIAGVDTSAREGPRRVVAAGVVRPPTMAFAVAGALAVAAGAGVTLAVLVGWELLAVGALAMLAALGYSGGRRPYASRGLGEVSVFVFFGLVATVGSQYVQDGHVGVLALIASVPVGLVAVALLVVNNLRDIHTDAEADKRTLAVRLGDARTRLLYQGLLASAVAWLVPVALATRTVWPMLAAVSLPVALHGMRIVGRGASGRALVEALETTARFHIVSATLLAAGLVLAELATWGRFG